MPVATEQFSLRVPVRGYELDPQGHVNQAVYSQYAEHARWKLLCAAGVNPDALRAHGIAPVLLKFTLRFQRELRADDEVDVSCEFQWADRKLFEIVQDFRLPDETPVAKFIGTAGLIDLATRQLVSKPGSRMATVAKTPELLGLTRPVALSQAS